MTPHPSYPITPNTLLAHASGRLLQILSMSSQSLAMSQLQAKHFWMTRPPHTPPQAPTLPFGLQHLVHQLITPLIMV